MGKYKVVETLDVEVTKPTISRFGGMDRRRLLQYFIAIAAAGIRSDGIRQHQHTTKPGNYNIFYNIWNPDRDVIAEYRDQVSATIDPDGARNLLMVKDGKNYGLIEILNGDQESAQHIAEDRSKDLKAADLGEASIIRGIQYERLFNIQFGKESQNLEELKPVYERVGGFLGPDLGKELIIEERANGNFRVVYPRQSDYKSTQQRARTFSRQLGKFSIQATAIPDSNSEVAYNSSRNIDEIVNKPAEIVKSEPRKPEATATPTQPTVTTIIIDSELEAVLDAHFKQAKANGVIPKNTRIAALVYDYASGEQLASINADEPLQTASAMKEFLAEFYLRMRGGWKNLDATERFCLERMIQKSDNILTNWVMQKLGGPARIQELIETNYSGMLQQTHIVDFIPVTNKDKERTRSAVRKYQGKHKVRLGIDFDKLDAIPKGSSYYTNQASANDYGRFLSALFNNGLSDTNALKYLMGLPNGDRIYTLAKKVPKGTIVLNKTGTTAGALVENGLVYARGKDGQKYAYSFVVVLQHPSRASDYLGWQASGNRTTREASNIVYTYQKPRHNLI